MYERRSTAYNALNVLIATITLLNDLTLFTSQWIHAPGLTPIPAQAVPFPHPALTSVAYAIVEPLYAALFAHAGIPPWILVMASPLHLWVCELSMEYLSAIFAGRPRQSLSGSSPEPSGVEQAERKPVSLASERRPSLQERQPLWHTYIAIMLPVQSAAASNAALLLLAADLDVILKGDKAGLLLMFCYLAILFYVCSRYADVRISQRTYKTSLYRYQSLLSLTMQLGCLALLLSLKISVRKLLSINAFPMLSVLGFSETPRSLGQAAPPWLGALAARTPVWLPLVLAVVTVPLSIYGARRFRQGFEARTFTGP